ALRRCSAGTTTSGVTPAGWPTSRASWPEEACDDREVRARPTRSQEGQPRRLTAHHPGKAVQPSPRGPLMFEVRFHGRGGQGVVTAAETLSVAAFDDGEH